ncbi:MAG: hypothetical protein DRP78_00055 [Candidatus Omnitrophota bacterium]|nr:MAG: hypothetical protein DRP78_00055 [Candidatus Omnitrophota bacterium]
MAKIKHGNRKKIHRLRAKSVISSGKKYWPSILSWGLGLGTIVFLLININSFIFASPYFTISEINIQDNYSHKINYPISCLEGNLNIFKLDLKAVARDIEGKYPNIQKAIVKRVLPEQLVIEILRRSPVAQIEIKENTGTTHFFSINDEGYVLVDLGEKQNKKMPVICGIGLTFDDIVIGHCYSKANLQCGLSFIKELRQSGFLKHYRVTKIDVSNPRNLFFFIDDALEIKIGNRKWQDKIKNLGGILESMDIDYSQQYYLDLRFKDFVFGRKNNE